MAPRARVRCSICNSQDSKYSCPSCLIPYCSVACFKEHKLKSCLDAGPTLPAFPPLGEGGSAAPEPSEHNPKLPPVEEDLPNEITLRPLTSLKWPYIPEGSSYPDPLKRDDPKPLQLHQYEAIATSAAVRSALSTNPTLPALLRKLDKLRGSEREEALENLLGITTERHLQNGNDRRGATRETRESEEDTKALKQLAEAVEKAVRGEKPDVLGLDWTEDA